MPAAAVIPTPRVSMVDAAVKKSVVMRQSKDHGRGGLVCRRWGTR